MNLTKETLASIERVRRIEANTSPWVVYDGDPKRMELLAVDRMIVSRAYFSSADARAESERKLARLAEMCDESGKHLNVEDVREVLES